LLSRTDYKLFALKKGGYNIVLKNNENKFDFDEIYPIVYKRAKEYKFIEYFSDVEPGEEYCSESVKAFLTEHIPVIVQNNKLCYHNAKGDLQSTL